MYKKVVTGFTLIEILIVVIIIAVLAALSIPIFTKNMERARAGEAANILNIIRMVEKDYFLDNNTYTSDFSSLNIDNPNDVTSSNRYFDYTLGGTDLTVNFTATATRNGGSAPYIGDYYTIDETGAIDSDNGSFPL